MTPAASPHAPPRAPMHPVARAPRLPRLQVRDTSALTAREIATMTTLFATGSNKTSAARLGMSVRTIEIHLGNLFRKLGMNRHQAMCALAYLAGVRDGMGDSK